MNILYFYQYFTVPEGSYSTRVYEFTRRWVKSGDSVIVVTSVYDKSGLKPERLISRFDIEGIDVRMINIRLSNKHGFLFRIFTFAAYAVLACWYALTLKADVVISSSGPLTVGLPGLVARYIRRRPFVFEVRDLWPEGAIQLGILRNGLAIRLARALEKLCYRSASRIVALSEGMADWIRKTYGFDHIDVIPNASDNDLVRSIEGALELPAWARGKRLVLYTGTLGLIDDCGQMLDVAHIIERRGIHDIEFVLIGDGKERPQLEEKARSLGLSHVHFLGLMPKEAVMRWLMAADCSMFTVKDVPFLATASPNKVFDAFAAGTPVVQASQGWIKDLLERERCGITVAPNDLEAMADAVLRVVRDGELRNAMAANARRAASTLFDRALLATRMRNILLNVAQGHNKAGVRLEVADPAESISDNRMEAARKIAG
ncbi:MAG TPA: glycosyltransferase family 4 protein [Blastocatellia bacterium]|nr:glycosyltransferase family 4 protein [Blastocatellia bacterium]